MHDMYMVLVWFVSKKSALAIITRYGNTSRTGKRPDVLNRSRALGPRLHVGSSGFPSRPLETNYKWVKVALRLTLREFDKLLSLYG
jgi:hypothetical protein